MGRKHKQKVHKKAHAKGHGKWLAILIVLLCVALVYISFASYFETHFLPKTTVNGYDVSFMTVTDVENVFSKKVEDYKLAVTDNSGETEEISGKAINLKYNSGKTVQTLLKEQNNMLWLFKLKKIKRENMKVNVSFSRDLLDATIKKMNLMKDNAEKAVSAKIQYHDGRFVIVPESVGKEISVEKFEEEAAKAVLALRESLNLVQTDCYVKPQFTKDSPEVIEACNAMNKYLDMVITYDVAPKNVQIDKNQIKDWIFADEKFKIHIADDRILDYVKDTLKKEIDTVGTERTITAPNGRTSKIVGVNYGWKIDPEKEKNQIVKDLKGMTDVKREPVYDYRAESHAMPDWGNTYVEVSISDQKAWIVKDGAVAAETDIVSGNPNKGDDTDKGVFIIQNKLKDTVLRGPKENGKYKWESPVKYWMQFTRKGQGFHDASWQSAFGGQRYKEGYGSHGCVNMPLSAAEKFYALTYNGMPVIIHD